MFDLDQFTADCRTALEGEQTSRNIKEVVARAVAEPAALMAAIGEPTAGGITPLHRSDDLTIINVIWQPHMVLMPHDHRMWAVIGVYTGREDNIFWRRLADEGDRQVEAAGAKSLCEGDTVAMGPDVIHSVVNPVARLTGAIHVYGGDFFAQARSEWEAETLREQPFNVDRLLRAFAG